MSEHLYTHRKTSDQSASISQHSPFQPRPFVVQTQTEEQSEQPDIKTALQRAEGYGHRLDRIKFSENHAPAQVRRIVQAKLTIGEPGDKYEQEADRVAASVVSSINVPSSQQTEPTQAVQRQEEEEEEIQAKPEITALQRQKEPVEEIQAKLSISDQKRSPLPSKVQLEAKPEEEELQTKSILQRREGIGRGEASTDVESAINSARGGGQPLEAGLQRSMGQAMGADFSGVKVHIDSQADQLNQSIQARAFTTGQDVFFRSGEYNPGSRGGQELIAHELTHVIQQNGGTVQRTLGVGTTSKLKGEDYANNVQKLINMIDRFIPNFADYQDLKNALDTINKNRSLASVDSSEVAGQDLNNQAYGDYVNRIENNLSKFKFEETEKSTYNKARNQLLATLNALFDQLPVIAVDPRVGQVIDSPTTKSDKKTAKEKLDNALQSLADAMKHQIYVLLPKR